MGRGHLAEAEERFGRALAVYERLSDQKIAMALCWFFLAQAACERGALAEAGRRCRAARRLNRGQDADAEAGTTWVRACVQLLAGRVSVAARLVEQVSGLLLAGGGTLATSMSPHVALLDALVRLERGAMAEAQATAEAVLAQAARSGRRQEEALALHTLARCARARGDLAEAETHLRRALVIQEEFGFALDAPRTRLTLAEVLVAGAGSRAVPQEALALVAGARAQCAASGAARDLAHAEQLAAAWVCC
jgi:tetratricopeptide (TPR) repeat protein